MGFLQDTAKSVTVQNDYQARKAKLDHTDYSGAVQKGLDGNIVDNTQSNATADQQNSFIEALKEQAAGHGPSQAENQLQEATDKNNQMSAGSIASQRGMNPAAAARLILQQQAANNQAAAGQAATTRTQEQLNAQGQLGSALGTKRTQDIGQSQGNATADTAYLTAAAGAQNNQNQVDVNNNNGVNSINAGVSAQNTNNTNATMGGIGGGIAQGALHLADGGMIPNQDVRVPDYGVSHIPQPLLDIIPLLKKKKEAPIASGSSGYMPDGSYNSSTGLPDGGTTTAGGAADAADYGSAAEAGSAAGVADEAGAAVLLAAHGAFVQALREGGKVPGRAKVKGDNPKNDTVPAMLSPGEVVVPRSKVNDPEKAKEFIEALKNHGSKKPVAQTGYAKVLETQRLMNERLAHLERLSKGN